MKNKELVQEICKVIAAKKGENIVIINLEGISLLADYFIICNGNSRVQTQAIADYLEKEMSQQGLFLERREGYTEGCWILQDYGSIIVHIFLTETREFYNLERLWGDAEIIQYREKV